jgi:hypothetical protein
MDADLETVDLEAGITHDDAHAIRHMVGEYGFACHLTPFHAVG